MILVGMLDSPYVRRVAISAQFLGIAYEHRPLSVFNDYDEIRKLNPLVKAPTLICDDDTQLVDSTLIIEYFTRLSRNGHSLTPSDDDAFTRSQQLLGVALVAMEKIVQITYETMRRPSVTQHQPWLDRLLQQLNNAMHQLNTAVTIRDPWLFGKTLSQADITIAVAWRVSQFIVEKFVNASDFENLVEFSLQSEALAEFKSCPLSTDH